MKLLNENSARIAFLILAAVAGGNLVYKLTGTNAEAKTRPAAQSSALQRGEYLVRVGGCADCHTLKKMGAHGPEDDATRWLSGHPENAKLPPPPAVGDSPWIASTAGMTAWAGPRGVSFAANLTPDANTGLGIWTEEMFLEAMRSGRHMGSGRQILPPMPWEGVAKLSDADLKAVFTYLRTVPPVTNHVPNPLAPDGKSFE